MQLHIFYTRLFYIYMWDVGSVIPILDYQCTSPTMQGGCPIKKKKKKDSRLYDSISSISGPANRVKEEPKD